MVKLFGKGKESRNFPLLGMIFIALVVAFSGTFIVLNVLEISKLGDFFTGLVAGEANVTVNQTTTITLVVSTVNFATLNPPELGANFTDSTVDDSPAPFRVRNDGTVLVNVSISATSLWQTDSNPTWNFTAACGNYSESNCYDTVQSVDGNETFFRISSSSSVLVVSNLNQSATKDEREIEINISVPRDEGSGARGSTVTVTAVSA